MWALIGVGIDLPRGGLAQRTGCKALRKADSGISATRKAEVRFAFISAGTASGIGLMACTRCRIFNCSTTPACCPSAISLKPRDV